MIYTGTDYSDQVFNELHLGQAHLDSNEFHDCIFVRCNFVETTFRNCRFINCVFQHCDLSLVQVPDSSFAATRFENSKVIGVNWAKAHWPEARLWDSLCFSKCAISHSTFIGLNLRRIQIQDCLATNVDFRETDLYQADFSGTDLSDSLFLNTDLTEADLSDAHNYQMDPRQNVIKKTKFSLPEAMSLLYSMDIILIDE